jgi:adenylate cyclase
VDAAQRIEVLADLPGVIRLSPSEEDLEKRVLDVLLRGIPRAESAAVVWVDTAAAEPRPIHVREQARRGSGPDEFRPSRRLVCEAVLYRRQSVMHIWRTGDLNPDFSVPPGSDWAICSPLPDAPIPGFALYVSGRLLERSLLGGPTREETSKSDLKFAELVAEVFGALRQVRDLERRQSVLSRFLPQQVLAALSEQDIEDVLQPRQTDVTVLFCDLRGSTRIAEDAAGDLARLWDSVSAALGTMASSIIDRGGVIGDFQGDAAMGFWGWPLPVEDQIERAAQAALNIQRRFAWAAQQPDNPLSVFSCGIGVAHGPAIAGRLGAIEQFKVDVFGPVVNLASRLESLTKVVGVPILVDERSADRLCASKDMRCRRVARIRPYGMRAALTVSTLWRPGDPGQLSSKDRLDFDAGFEAFGAGRWDDARRLLKHLSRDGPTEFLKQFMDRYPDGPPPDWDGVIAMESK